MARGMSKAYLLRHTKLITTVVHTKSNVLYDEVLFLSTAEEAFLFFLRMIGGEIIGNQIDRRTNERRQTDRQTSRVNHERVPQN